MTKFSFPGHCLTDQGLFVFFRFSSEVFFFVYCFINCNTFFVWIAGDLFLFVEWNNSEFIIFNEKIQVRMVFSEKDGSFTSDNIEDMLFKPCFFFPDLFHQLLVDIRKNKSFVLHTRVVLFLPDQHGKPDIVVFDIF